MYIEISDTKNSPLIADSLTDLDFYRQSKELSLLESAREKLERARNEDPQYMPAVYYSAVVDDLMGRAEDAIHQLEQLLEKKPAFVDEVRYHLALAHYHRYSRPHLEKAAEYFKAVIKNTDNGTLRMLARAGLAQAYAMRMIQPDPRNPDLADARKYFNLAVTEYKSIIKALESKKIESARILRDIKWEVYNGHGMALMYYTDYFGEVQEKVSRLKLALKELNKADRYSPENWANYCDMGSVNMRLAHWLKSQERFQSALGYLREVVTRLRPNYGFALYEMGRTYRLMGRFKMAVRYFDKALAIEYVYRDVSDKRINLEKERAGSASTEYP